MQVQQRLNVGLVAGSVVRRDGQGRVAMEIAKCLATRGHSVHSYSVEVADEIRSIVEWVPVSTGWGPQLTRDYFFARNVLHALEDRTHDVILTMGACAAPARGPVVYYAAYTHKGWSSVWNEVGYKPSMYHRLHAVSAGRLERIALKGADSVIVMSQRMAAELQPLLKPRSQMTVIPGAVDSAEYTEPGIKERKAARARLGLSADSFVISMIGEHATGRKGLHYLARAIGSADHSDEVILVHGAGSESTTIARDLKPAGVDDITVFIDPRQPVADVVAASDIVTVPSIYEPFSLVAVEAAASAVPVIVSRRAGAADHLGPRGGALVVEPTDTGAFRKAIDAIKSNPEFARQLGAKGRNAAAEVSWSRITGMIADVIESTARAPR